MKLFHPPAIPTLSLLKVYNDPVAHKRNFYSACEISHCVLCSKSMVKTNPLSQESSDNLKAQKVINTQEQPLL